MSLASLLLMALVLDALLGEPDWLWSRLPHPAVLMGRFVETLDDRLNHGENRRMKGVLALTIMICTASAVGLLLVQAGPIAEVLIAAILLAQKSLLQHVNAVANSLSHSIGAGRETVAMIVSRDTAAMDESQIARSAIESAAENFSDGVIAPAFWFLIAGLPGIMIYKMVNTADSMIGYRNPTYEQFGWASARCDDLVNLIPARLSAVLIVIAAGNFDLSAVRKDARLHRSPNAGWPEAAMARALGVALSGPRSYDGELRAFPWVNDTGRRDLTAKDIDASLIMLWKSWGGFAALCLALALFF